MAHFRRGREIYADDGRRVPERKETTSITLGAAEHVRFENRVETAQEHHNFLVQIEIVSRGVFIGILERAQHVSHTKFCVMQIIVAMPLRSWALECSYSGLLLRSTSRTATRGGTESKSWSRSRNWPSVSRSWSSTRPNSDIPGDASSCCSRSA